MVKVLWRVVAGIALLYAGFVHLHLASRYDGGGILSTGNQFRAQFAASVITVLLLAVPRRWAWWPAVAVAAATAAAVLASVYLTVGPIGPFPALPREPWYAEKAYSALAEGVVVVAAILAYGSGRRRRGRQRRPDSEQSTSFRTTSA